MEHAYINVSGAQALNRQGPIRLKQTVKKGCILAQHECC